MIRKAVAARARYLVPYGAGMETAWAEASRKMQNITKKSMGARFFCCSAGGRHLPPEYCRGYWNSFLEALNLRVLPAGMVISAPVRGFRPLRAEL